MPSSPKGPCRTGRTTSTAPRAKGAAAVGIGSASPRAESAATPVAGGKECDDILMTGVITIEPHGTGSKYSALVIHASEQARKKHEKMGFHEGWGMALDQLVAYMKTTS